MNKIIDAAIHDLIKEEAGFTVKLAAKPLRHNATLQRVIDSISDQYARKTSKSYGKFSEDDDNFPTQKNLRAYVERHEPFISFTSKLMDTLAVQARRKSAATGGHVLFSHFENAGAQFLLVAIVNDKLGARLTDDLDVSDVTHLDMEGFRFAGRVDFARWIAGAERCIGFLKGKGDVSEYFQEFLGCSTVVQARKDTSELVKILKTFVAESEMPLDRRESFLSSAMQICQAAANKRIEIQLETLANTLMPESPSKLLAVLTSPEHMLNDNFVPDRISLRALVKIKAKTDTWSLEFDRSAISQSKIVYDRLKRTLIIKELPASLVAELEDECGDEAN